jgi:hypothetical protein
MPRDLEEWATLFIGLVAGYYLVSHYGRTGQPA